MSVMAQFFKKILYWALGLSPAVLALCFVLFFPLLLLIVYSHKKLKSRWVVLLYLYQELFV